MGRARDRGGRVEGNVTTMLIHNPLKIDKGPLKGNSRYFSGTPPEALVRKQAK